MQTDLIAPVPELIPLEVGPSSPSAIAQARGRFST